MSTSAPSSSAPERPPEAWQGALPSPEALRAFGEVDPSFPSRILHLVEAASRHQREMEREALRQQGEAIQADAGTRQRGQRFAAGLAVFFGLVGAFMGYLGHPASATTVITGTVVGLATIFLLGRSAEGGRSGRE